MKTSAKIIIFLSLQLLMIVIFATISYIFVNINNKVHDINNKSTLIDSLKIKTDCSDSIKSLEQELKICFRIQDKYKTAIGIDKLQLNSEIEYLRREGARISKDARLFRSELMNCEQKNVSCQEALNQCIEAYNKTNK